VHLVRYEDILADPEPVLKGLLEFVLDLDDISGTKLLGHVQAAVKEDRPQNYKPRHGEANANYEKYTPALRSLMLHEAGQQISTLGFNPAFGEEDLEADEDAKIWYLENGVEVPRQQGHSNSGFVHDYNLRSLQRRNEIKQNLEQTGGKPAFAVNDAFDIRRPRPGSGVPPRDAIRKWTKALQESGKRVRRVDKSTGEVEGRPSYQKNR